MGRVGLGRSGLALVALSVVEQRLDAVRVVFAGATVTEVAARTGVLRQTLHSWLSRYASMPRVVCDERLGSVGVIAELRPLGSSWRHQRLICRAARPRARDERQGRTAARRGALARRLDPIERNSASVTPRDGDGRRVGRVLP
jgi:hypothetical protein